ncbi:YdiK family protein [Virgibacillus byunsanensis]|uniref:YdiK family protein n=1 Tax=Virgibacillus byunsanensis TaxID=570945 RepID=A0ABW3LKM6_9BACI
MKTTPKGMAIVYFLLGILFTYIAVQSAEETIWNFTTIIFALFATLDFGVGLRMFTIHIRLKKNNNKKE